MDDAVVEAKLLAGLKADEKVELLILPKPRNFFEQLLDGPQVEAEFRMLPSEILPAVRATSVWQRLFKRPINAVLPFHVDFH